METDSTDKDWKPTDKDPTKTNYLCAFCHFIFSTKSGYMEHTKLGNCVQVSFCTYKFGYKYFSQVIIIVILKALGIQQSSACTVL